MKMRTHVLSWRVFNCATAFVLVLGLWGSGAFADMPASSVTTAAVNAGQSYPEVPINGEGWFDVGGFCKVVDVGGLTWSNPPATGVPVFIDGDPAQWENYRTLAPSNYRGDLLLTTCCRPQSNIATLCTEDGATPVSVSRQYGKLGETDTVVATCTGFNGAYQDSVSLKCSGDNGPDGQATWSESGPDSPTCTTAPTTTYGACSTAGVGGWGNQLATVKNCLGQVLSQSYSGPSCYTAPPCTPSYSYACEGSSYVRTDNNSCSGPATVGSCTLITESGTCSCNAGYVGPYTFACGTDTYYQCTGGNTGFCSGSCVSDPCQYWAAFPTGTCSAGPTCPVLSETCTSSYWAPP